MDERFNHYHLHYHQHDLLYERDQDRLVKLAMSVAASDQRITWRDRLSTVFMSFIKSSHQTETIPEKQPPDAKAVNGKRKLVKRVG
ncbi:MAG TPA: hypothetical protein VHL11_05865 [Phototrophicaceae bacterium]|jgi:hypothetical protein|nr:hypothetical protein [Phototrophicaceae bacterium]